MFSCCALPEIRSWLRHWRMATPQSDVHMIVRS